MSLLPDCGGPILTLATALHPEMFRSRHAPYDREYAAMRRALAAFVDRLEAGMRLLVFTEMRAARSAERWLASLRSPAALELRPLADGAMANAADLWCQDPVLVTDNAPAFLQPANHRDRGHASWLAAAMGVHVRDLGFALDGGNLLVGPDFLLVGADERDRSPDILRRLAALDPRPAHLVGAGAELRQALFHLDLFLSVTGLRDGGRPLLLLAEPRATLPRHAGEAAELAEVLDETAEMLADAGFALRRQPVALAPAPFGRKLRLRPGLNGLVENALRPGRARPIAWLPGYADREPQLAAFDEAAAALWGSLGFEPRLCPGWSATAHAHGALRCAVKVMSRADTA